MKKIIFYDLDGTLVDTREDIVCSANYMLGQMGLPILSHDEIAGYVGRGVHALIGGCLKSNDRKIIEKGIRIYRDHYAEHMLDHSQLFPGALGILEYYRAAKQIVLTNKPNPFSRDLLKALGVADFFSEIIAGDEIYPKKPDPAAIFAMMKTFSLEPSQAVFIGDSRVDIETARNAGIPVAVLTHGFSTLEEVQSASPEIIAGSFPELLGKIKEKGW